MPTLKCIIWKHGVKARQGEAGNVEHLEVDQLRDFVLNEDAVDLAVIV
jgi:hypothetical protein